MLYSVYLRSNTTITEEAVVFKVIACFPGKKNLAIFLLESIGEAKQIKCFTNYS